MIVRRGHDWLLLTRDGSRVLGVHSSRAGAEAQEQAVHASQGRSRPNPRAPRRQNFFPLLPALAEGAVGGAGWELVGKPVVGQFKPSARENPRRPRGYSTTPPRGTRCAACNAREATEFMRDASGRAPVCEPCLERFLGIEGPKGARRSNGWLLGLLPPPPKSFTTAAQRRGEERRSNPLGGVLMVVGNPPEAHPWGEGAAAGAAAGYVFGCPVTGALAGLASTGVRRAMSGPRSNPRNDRDTPPDRSAKSPLIKLPRHLYKGTITLREALLRNVPGIREAIKGFPRFHGGLDPDQEVVMIEDGRKDNIAGFLIGRAEDLAYADVPHGSDKQGSIWTHKVSKSKPSYWVHIPKTGTTTLVGAMKVTDWMRG